MARLETAPTRAGVSAFLKRIPDGGRRADRQALVKLMKRVTGARPIMWGPSIAGFGRCHYCYESGR